MGNKKGNLTRPAEETLYTIGKLARKASERSGLRCTPTMIYNYERLGLMGPPRKTEGGTRLYSDRALDRLVLIKRLQREFGGSLDETKDALASVEDPSEFERDKSKLRQFILEQKRSRKISKKKFVESKEARKSTMINAALDLFEKKGYHRTTIADITSRSGTSHGTFYLYFKDKNALIQEIVGGKATHPIFGLPGGISQPLSKENRDKITKMTDELVEFGKFTLQVVHDFILKNKTLVDVVVNKDLFYHETYYMGMVNKKNELNFYDGEIRIIDPAGKEFGRRNRPVQE